MEVKKSPILSLGPVPQRPAPHQEGVHDFERREAIARRHSSPRRLLKKVLMTDKSLGATKLWELYMTLLKAQGGFAQLKGTLV